MGTANQQRNQVKRGRKRASYEHQQALNIIDETLICHVAQSVNNQPFVTPTSHWRDGNNFYWHGHARARNTYGSKQQQVSINICQLDGLVLARSAFHHSVNYRSLTLFGQPQLIEDEGEKLKQLKLFIDKFSPQRWEQLRPITEKELMLTSVMVMPIDEFSIKHRNEPPVDEPEDMAWPVWAGVMPLNRQWGALQQDPQQDESFENKPQQPAGF